VQLAVDPLALGLPLALPLPAELPQAASPPVTTMAAHAATMNRLIPPPQPLEQTGQADFVRPSRQNSYIPTM
jgi:hypothetical protein